MCGPVPFAASGEEVSLKPGVEYLRGANKGPERVYRNAEREEGGLQYKYAERDSERNAPEKNMTKVNITVINIH